MGLGRFFKRDDRQPLEPDRAGPQARDDEADDLAARAADLSYSFGKMRPEEQRIAAVERLTELRVAGKVSEENYVKEKRRLMGEG